MSVNQTPYCIQYTGDGQSTGFIVPYYYVEPQDLIVFLRDPLNNIKTLVYGSDYTVQNTPSINAVYPNGGTVQMVTAPAAASIVTIVRHTPRMQPQVYNPEDPFPAKAHEVALDKLELQIQEISLPGFLGLFPGPPTSGNFLAGDWFIVTPFVAGEPWAYFCTVSGNPGTWNASSGISL